MAGPKNWHAELIETARQKPEEAVGQLFDLLGSQTQYGETVVLALDRNGCFPDRVQVDPNNWHSGTTIETDRFRILQVGLKLLSPQERSFILFDEASFTPEAEVAYRFSHELTHHLVEELAQKIPDAKELHGILIEKIKTARAGTGNGFSTLGSLRVYATQGVDMQVLEDTVELCNMYIRSPDYLRKFLSFLSAPHYEETRKQCKLVTLKDREAADLLFDLIETFIQICTTEEGTSATT
jgi:hypothetical protein